MSAALLPQIENSGVDTGADIFVHTLLGGVLTRIDPSKPTAYTFDDIVGLDASANAHTAEISVDTGSDMADHVVPSKCMMVLRPTAYTDLPSGLDHTPRRSAVVFDVILVHVAPSKWRIVPPPPTANASVLLFAHTELRSAVTGLVMPVHAFPLKRRIVPPAPTANGGDNPSSVPDVGEFTAVHDVPSNC